MNHLRKYILARPVWIISFAILLLAAGVMLLRWGTAAGQSAGGTAGYSEADQTFIQGLQQSLDNNRLNAADRQALEKKLEFSQRLAAQQAANPGSRGPKGNLAAPVPMPQSLIAPTQDLAGRIIPGSEGMIHSWEASINNMWEGPYNGTQYQVLAGASPEDPAQGLLIVFEYPANRGAPIRYTYRAPSGSGSLTIVQKQGGHFRCTTSSGTALTFNLDTRVFQ
jgi:hypothetical protein